MKIMCMEKYFTVCGIGNGGGIIVDSIYQQYAIMVKNYGKTVASTLWLLVTLGT